MAFWNNTRQHLNTYLSPAYISALAREIMARLKSARTLFAMGTLSLIGKLPRKTTLMVGSIFGQVFYFSNQKRRRIANINLEMCFPHWPLEKRRQLVREHFKRYGQAMVDLGMLWLSSDHRLNRCMNVSGIEHWHKANREGHPVIFLTPHVVAVDLAGTVLARFVPVCTMMKDLNNLLMNQRVKEYRSRFGLKLYSRSRGMRPLIRNLLNKVSCYYIPDQDFGTANSVFVPFFGVPVATLSTLGRMARLTDAKVLPMRSYLDPDTGIYNITISEPLDNFPQADEHVNARRMNAVFEDIIKERPDQYMWTLRWFKTRPNNEKSPY